MRVLGWKVTCQPLISREVRLICRAWVLSHSTVQAKTPPPRLPGVWRGRVPGASSTHPDKKRCCLQGWPAGLACSLCAGFLGVICVLQGGFNGVGCIPLSGLPRPTRAGLSTGHRLSVSAGGASLTPPLQPWALPSRPRTRLLHCLHPRGGAWNCWAHQVCSLDDSSSTPLWRRGCQPHLKTRKLRLREVLFTA